MNTHHKIHYKKEYMDGSFKAYCGLRNTKSPITEYLNKVTCTNCKIKYEEEKERTLEQYRRKYTLKGILKNKYNNFIKKLIL